MKKEVILKQIGNGQFTIPQSWRKLLNIDNNYAKATLEGNKVVITSLDDNIPEWDIKNINFESLSKDAQDDVLTGIDSYKKGKIKHFSSHNEFWNDV